MTLALLLTAVTGAWADYYVSGNGSGNWCNGEGWSIADANKMTESNGIYSITFANVAVPEEGSDYQFKIVLNNWDDAFGATSAVNDNMKLNRTLQGASVNNTQVIAENITFTITATSDVTISFNPTDKTFMISTTGMKVGDDITVEPVEGNTKQWTFAMPASDVVLTPIYAAATVYGADGQTEKQAYETLKEAFANVQDGDVIKLDWNVTLTEDLATPTIDGGVKFTLDFNGYTIDGGTTYIIQLKNAGDQLTFTDSSDDQLGGLIAQNFNVESGKEFVFVAGRYNFYGTTAEMLNVLFCANPSIPFSVAEGKEFVDLEGGAEANDGFTVRVDWKTFELTIGPKKFATFYDDNNITLAEGQNIGFYTISNISDDRSTATVTQINSTIIPANTPTLVYNGGNDQQTVKLKVTTDAVNLTVDYVEQFKGTATDREFTADDMADNDYFALSGGKAFAPVKGTGTIAAHKCWLEFAKQQIPSARQLTIVFDNDDATGVGSIDNGQLTIDNWYDLSGRKIANGQKPTAKGVYIKNGQKVVK